MARFLVSCTIVALAVAMTVQALPGSAQIKRQDQQTYEGDANWAMIDGQPCGLNQPDAFTTPGVALPPAVWDSIGSPSTVCGTCISITNKANNQQVFVPVIDECDSDSCGTSDSAYGLKVTEKTYMDLAETTEVSSTPLDVDWFIAPVGSC